MTERTKSACLPLLETDLEHVLIHTSTLWDEVRGSSLFITGGTGFFGMWLVESFCHINKRLALNAKATLLTRDPQSFASKAPHIVDDASINLHRGDVRKFSFPEEQYRFIVHAGTTASWNVAPNEMFSTIVTGTERILSFAHRARVNKLLFVSSGAVYGKQLNVTHIPEDYPGCPDQLSPNCAYGEGKRAGELLCAIANSETGLECKIARCFAFTGPHLPLDGHFAVGNFINDGLKGGPILVDSDGTALRSYLYAADLAIWLWTILLSGVRGRPYNVGSDQQMSIAETATTVAEVMKLKTKVVIARSPDSGSEPSRYVPSVQRAYDELDLCPTIDFREGLRRTIAWNRANDARV